MSGIEHRKGFMVKDFPIPYWEEEPDNYDPASNLESAQIISSLVEGSDNLHMPALDIDFHAQLVPSSTAGHYHLYLDKSMTWRKYKLLLFVLYKVGVIEKGFYKASVARGRSQLRSKNFMKADSEMPF